MDTNVDIGPIFGTGSSDVYFVSQTNAYRYMDRWKEVEDYRRVRI
jgi:hypothetical protein